MVHCDNCGFEGGEAEYGVAIRDAKVVPPRLKGVLTVNQIKDVGYRCPKCGSEFGFEAQ